MNLFEILQSAGGGEAFKVLAGQYGMSEDDVRRAAEALLPAFSIGVRQGTASPPDLIAFLRLLATGDFTRAYTDPSILFRARPSDADKALQLLFGPAAIAEAVSKQASLFSGLSEEKLRALMAPLAALALGGLAERASTANPVLDALLKQFGGGATSQGAPKGPLDRLEEEQAGREAEASGIADIQRVQQQLIDSGLAAFQAGTSAWQQAMSDMMKGAAKGGVSDEPGIQVSGRDLFGEMFDSGVPLSETYRRGVEALVQRMAPPSRK